MIWYAHKSKDDSLGRGYRERLECHLLRVALLTRNFAGRFGAPSWGVAAGLLHDVGKYLEEFQRRLDGDPTRVDHSIGGAKAAIDLFGYPGRLIAYGVAGHHAGLPDGSGPGDDTLNVRLKKKEAALPEVWRQRITPPQANTLIKEAENVLGSGADVFAIAFFARMLFSCLVDADFLATEWFLDKKRKQIRRTKLPAVAELAPVLSSWLDENFRAPKTEIELCRAEMIELCRAEILTACRKAAAEKPGVFSLAVPTGSGKTFSSLSFAFDHAKTHGLERVVYAVPYTAIIEQTADEFRKALKKAGDHLVLEHHSAAEPPPADEGGLIGPRRLRLATENWDAPLIVTTTVQLFESLYAARPSRCRKLHNLARAVIVLDEVQALPLPRLSACLAALKELSERYGTTILLCSATIPALDGNPRLPVALPKARAIIAATPALATAFRRTQVRRINEKLSDEELAKRLSELKQVLCIVDTRSHAAELYDRLPQDGRYHLTAAMCPAHRRKVLADVKAALAEKRRCRLVANAVIQAGVDISFPEVWRALAGVDSLAQADGRCNRHGENSDLGRFVIFETARPNAIPKNMVDLLRRRQITKTILEDNSDPLAAETVEKFFNRLLRNTELDVGGVRTPNGCWNATSTASIESIPFRSVGTDFRMIDDETSPLFIEWDDSARKLVTELRGLLAFEIPDPGRLRLVLRRLQSYTVGIYGLAKLKGQRDAEALDADGRFYVLVNRRVYDDATGLRLDRAGVLEAANLVV